MTEDSPSARRHVVVIALILVAVAAVFGQTANDEFISLDDGAYVARNPHMAGALTWAQLRWAVTDVSMANWHPVNTLSHVFMAAAFGLDAGPHHVANVVLHALNSVLLYAVLFRLTGAFWPSLVATLLFAVHPLRVESVAWVSERKGLLCAFFGFLAVLAYERYARAPGVGKYLLVFTAFVLSLLSKAALVALPFALLLLDYWPLGRCGDGGLPKSRSMGRLVAEKIPLIAASVAITIVAYYAQAQAGTVQSFQNFPLTVRAGNAIESYGMYLLNTLAPVNLALNYPHPGRAVFGQPALYVSLLVLIGFTTAAVWTFKSRPWFAVGWFWFAGLLVPVIGVVVLAEQSRADRYTYFPQIGLFVALAWGLDELRRRFPASRLLTAAAAVWIVALGVAAFVQTARWRDDYTWFTYNVDRVPSSAQAHYGLGVAYLKRDDIEMAEKCFLDAIELRPPVYEAYSNLGAIELRRGNFVKSGDYFAQALSLAPEKPDLIVNFGVSLYNLGQFGRALDVAEDALRIDPGHPRAIELRDACRTALQGGQALR